MVLGAIYQCDYQVDSLVLEETEMFVCITKKKKKLDCDQANIFINEIRGIHRHSLTQMGKVFRR